MANEKGAKRLTAALFSRFGDFPLSSPLRAIRVHPCRSLGSVSMATSSARTIYFTRGLSLFKKIETRDRNLTQHQDFLAANCLIKVFY